MPAILPGKTPKEGECKVLPHPRRSPAKRPPACRRCRPDWFYRGEEWYETLYEKTADRVRTSVSVFSDASDLAGAAGLSRTALNVLFRRHAHESPAAFLRRTRVEHACALLAAGHKPAQAAAAGFESSSAFHEHFLARTGLTPGNYAALATRANSPCACPPLPAPGDAGVLWTRPLSISERVRPNGFQKAALITGNRRPCSMSLSRVTRQFAGPTQPIDSPPTGPGSHVGLGWDASGFERHFGAIPCWAIHRPPAWFADADDARAMGSADMGHLGQQISLRAAVALRRALIGRYGIAHSAGCELIRRPGLFAAGRCGSARSGLLRVQSGLSGCGRESGDQRRSAA